ncbi:ATP-binding cassette domain-containing protein [Erysipelothrix sp. HDW6C]|nr:ATP-binding cassette domain-containing protein [Erysipelothrix sp. HDW6C]
MIQFKNVSKKYTPTFTAIDSLNLEIRTGEIFGIIGESGAGKSTLLRMVNQLEQQDSGTILVDGVDVKSLSARELQKMRHDIAVIFQNYNLLANRTVYDNVALPLRLRNQFDSQAVDDALAFVGLNDKASHYPRQLSGGEKQRVAIARAIITKPKILICDEPTSALDQSTTHDILRVLESINSTFNTTIIIVTHALPLAKAVCKRAALLEQGKLIDVIDVKPHAISKQQRYIDHAVEVLTQ